MVLLREVYKYLLDYAHSAYLRVWARSGFSNAFAIYAIIVENGLLFLSFALIDRVILAWKSESFFE